MRSLLRAGWLRGALVALLLFAQHGALTHALSHFAPDGDSHGEVVHVHAQHDTHHDGHHDEGPAGSATASCAFDLVYSQVLGGVHADPFAAFAAAGQVLAAAAVLAVRGSVTSVPYDSRGPPVLS